MALGFAHKGCESIPTGKIKGQSRDFSSLLAVLPEKKGHARAWPACVFSRRKSGAETSTVRHISYNLERMRLPMRCSSASSRIGGINLPPRRVVLPSVERSEEHTSELQSH